MTQGPAISTRPGRPKTTSRVIGTSRTLEGAGEGTADNIYLVRQVRQVRRVLLRRAARRGAPLLHHVDDGRGGVVGARVADEVAAAGHDTPGAVRGLRRQLLVDAPPITRHLVG